MNTQNLAKYNQEKNEGIQEFINRIFVLWNEEKKKPMWKNYYFTNRMFFIQLFITGIRDNEIRNRMSIWFKNRDPKKQDSIYSKDVVKIAKEFHKCQQKIPGFMEFLTTLEITDYEKTKKTIIGFINEYPEEVEPFLNWYWTQKIPEFMEYITRVGITDDKVTRRTIINFINKFINKYPEEVESYFNEHSEDLVSEYLEESDSDEHSEALVSEYIEESDSNEHSEDPVSEYLEESDEPNYNRYSQQINEEYIEYLTRIQCMWNNEKEIVIKTNQKFFFQLFINGIRDVDVKRRTNKWYKIYKWFNIEDCICIYNILEKAEEFQNEKDNVGEDSPYNILEKAEEFQKEKDNVGMDSPICIDLTGDTGESEDEE